jgi:hypothetical protein
MAAGTHLTGRVMDELIRRQAAAVETYRFFDYRQVKSDLKGFFTTPPYSVIFNDAARQRALLKIAGDLVIPEPILIALYHFCEDKVVAAPELLVLF